MKCASTFSWCTRQMASACVWTLARSRLCLSPMCVCVHTHTHTHTGTHARTHTRTHARTHTHTHVSHANVCVLYVFVCERECVRACVGGCLCVGLVQGRRAQVRDLLRWQDCRASESLWCPWYKFSKVLSILTLLFMYQYKFSKPFLDFVHVHQVSHSTLTFENVQITSPRTPKLGHCRH